MSANESRPAGNRAAELREALNTIRREREWQLTDKLRDYATSRGVNPVTEARE